MLTTLCPCTLSCLHIHTLSFLVGGACVALDILAQGIHVFLLTVCRQGTCCVALETFVMNLFAHPPTLLPVSDFLGKGFRPSSFPLPTGSALVHLGLMQTPVQNRNQASSVLTPWQLGL